jgi:spermidine synthase
VAKRDKPSKQSQSTENEHPGRLIILAAFFLSGLCGLIYEVAWARMLTLVFGSTTQSIATVLAIYMFGLGSGSFLAGRYVGRIRSLKNAYAFIEMGLGVYAVCFILVLASAQHLHAWVFPHVFGAPTALTTVRILIVAAILLVPTTLMGATLPILTQLLAPSRNIGLGVSRLYAVNTLGAALGAFFSAYAAIPTLGLNGTIYAGAAVNILLGLVVLKLPWDEPGHHLDSRSTPALKSARTAALVVSAAAGFIGMMLENSWSHALVMVFGTSVYAFATMLTSYLVGIGLGSLAAGRFADRVRVPAATLALVMAALGLSVLGTTPVIGRLPSWFVSVFSDMHSSWAKVISLEFGVCFLIMLLPTFFSGASFPIITRLAAQQGSTGRAVSDAYSTNTLGCIIGSLATGFLFIPSLGSERTLLLAGAIALFGAGGLLLSLSVPRRPALPVGLAVVGLAGFILLPGWDTLVMNSGVYVYSRYMAGSSIKDKMAEYKLLYYREGATATVAVLESRRGHRILRVNGKTDGSSEGDNYTQMLLGYLPSLYARHQENALVIGLGTGVSSSCVLDLPFKSVETAEISPEVIEAAHYFSELNNAVFSDPRSTLRVLDARTWLMAMPRSYDIITSEPSNPWQTGNANLFTVDFFRLAARRLAPGGVFTQWLPFYHMNPNHFRLILKSFRTVFPHVNVWLAATDTIIIGSMDPLVIDPNRLKETLARSAVRSKFASLGIDSSASLLSFFYLDEQATEAFTANTNGLNLDSRPVVEFDAPKYLLGPARPDILFAILDHSYAAKLPLAGPPDPSLDSARILSRRTFYPRWRFPGELTEAMISRSLGRQR